ncbi:hypothetical protein OS493_009229 [Desmophyllum pertusum]|uniref:Fibrinogen C-terminal domain-containing protein n=1 Tax=Desmophyllum pertusum TaxID=174260 RepID=A0A9X0CSC7_9CNID|nr:hypothetical protein OS493_009229 [Desmophyllum pertusum]
MAVLGRPYRLLGTRGRVKLSSNPGLHCLDILNSDQSSCSGLYWIDPNGGSTDDSYQAFCDMETEGGGWTLVATKVSPAFPFISAVFSPWPRKLSTQMPRVISTLTWGTGKRLCFGFSDVNTIRVIYNRKAGAPQNDKEEFEKFLMGESRQLIKNVHGFYKYSPATQNQRDPAGGFVTIIRLHYYSDRGISEGHSGTNKWLDMWRDSPSVTKQKVHHCRRQQGGWHQVYRGLLLPQQTNLGDGAIESQN